MLLLTLLEGVIKLSCCRRLLRCQQQTLAIIKHFFTRTMEVRKTKESSNLALPYHILCGIPLTAFGGAAESRIKRKREVLKPRMKGNVQLTHRHLTRVCVCVCVC